MVHAAYLFDYEQFQKEVEPLLKRALENEDASEIAAFVRKNQEDLYVPEHLYRELGLLDDADVYEAVALTDLEDWENVLEPDFYVWSDLLLTLCYVPGEELGLFSVWEDYLEGSLTPEQQMRLLGTPIEVLSGEERVLYYLTPEQVRDRSAIFKDLELTQVEDFDKEFISDFMELVREAERNQLGILTELYVVEWSNGEDEDSEEDD